MSDNQKQRVDSAACDVVSDIKRGNVDVVRKWLHGDGRYNVNTQAVVLHRAADEGHTDICQLVIDCGTDNQLHHWRVSPHSKRLSDHQ
jgi:hypothetical protein